MDLILSWSGTESQDLATFFRKWLPDVLPGIQHWISSEDIAKGKRWFDELTGQLSKTPAILVFVTPGNVRSPWLFFEVGSIAAKIDGSTVFPYLIGVDGKYVKDTPLGQFQWTEATKADTWKLIRSINKLLDIVHNETLLEGNFDNHWPRLKGEIDKVLESTTPIMDDIREVERSMEEQLSEEAKQLLIGTSFDKYGRLGSTEGLDGRSIQTSSEEFLKEGSSHRVEVIWMAALNQLVEFALLKSLENSDQFFEITQKGYDLADLIKSRTH